RISRALMSEIMLIICSISALNSVLKRKAHHKWRLWQVKDGNAQTLPAAGNGVSKKRPNRTIKSTLHAREDAYGHFMPHALGLGEKICAELKLDGEEQTP
ncbi:MAG: hypothetical protein M1608_05840, partial [Candidatus Omnitrophica bacterium]|nr:hypothetical protein [Candidatus Omnitrophota bacterium]